MTQPGDEILETFGIQLIAPLGGRLNQHWLVEAQRESLVLRRWSQPADEIGYELRLLERIAALGWPVAPSVGTIEQAGDTWSLFPFLPGDPALIDDPAAEQRTRGRLLATFHSDLVQMEGFKQRGRWRRCEEILGDPNLDRILADQEKERPEEVRLLRWHLERARERIAGLQLHKRPGIVIHGDFTHWNLRFKDGHLSGILDFELAHWDHRVADFALSWRGKYDDVIYGYTEVSALDSEEWELLTPMWWAWLIESACHDLAAGIRDDGWITKQLLRRSLLMGPDVVEYR